MKPEAKEKIQKAKKTGILFKVRKISKRSSKEVFTNLLLCSMAVKNTMRLMSGMRGENLNYESSVEYDKM